MALITFASVIGLIGAASSAPIYPVPLTYVALSPIPQNIYNQVQDTKSGEYAFGYAGGPVAREEAKTSDGVIRGAYSYVDAHGIVQYYRYVADDDGFRVVGTNIPTDVTPNPQLKQQPQENELQAMKTEAEKITSKKSEEQEESSSRKKRSAIYDHVPLETVKVFPTATLAVVGDASLPTATSSQSRVQIHKSSKSEIGYHVQPAHSESIALVREVPVAVQSIETIPVALPASVPTSTSSQFRHQVHNSVKAEIREAVPVIPVETVAALPATPVAVPVAVKSVEPIPVAVAASVATSTSSQSRHQVHNSVKAEIREAVPAIPVETVAALPATPVAVPVAVKSAEPIPVAVAASVATSTSSQSRHQVHNSVKAEIREADPVIPVETVAALPATPVAVPVAVKSAEPIPVAVAASVATSTSSQSRHQVHNSVKAEIREAVPVIPVEMVAALPATPVAVPVAVKSAEPTPASPIAVAASVPISTSSQQRFQTHDSTKTLNLQDSSHLSEYSLVNLQPTIGLQSVNAFSLPSLARNQVGVGLGVVPSPYLTYHNYGHGLFVQV